MLVEVQFLFVLNLGFKYGWVANALLPKKIPVPVLEVAVWASSLWTGVEKIKSLASTGVRTPERTAHNESYRLRFPSLR